MNQTTIAWKVVCFVAGCYRVQTAKLFTKSRNQKYAMIRQQCMWLLCSVAKAPITKIAKFFHRSKSTVSASIGKIQDLLRCDSVPLVFNFKRKFVVLLCETLRRYLRLIAVKTPMIRKKTRLRRAAFGGIS